MKHRFLGAIVTAACLASAVPLAAGGPPETAREIYTRALAQERTVRDAAAQPTLQQMRHVVALYESLGA